MLARIDEYLTNDPITAPIYHKEDKDIIKNGTSLTPSLFEFYAIAINDLSCSALKIVPIPF